VQQDLQRRLGAAAVEESSDPGPGGVLPRPSEFAIRSRDGWRSALERFRTRPQDAQENARAADARVRKAAEVSGVVVGCAEDMKALWEDSAVQEMLRRKKIRMEEEPGLYVIILFHPPNFTPSLHPLPGVSDLLMRRLVVVGLAASWMTSSALRLKTMSHQTTT
jgi:hypothetical protein